MVMNVLPQESKDDGVFSSDGNEKGDVFLVESTDLEQKGFLE